MKTIRVLAFAVVLFVLVAIVPPQAGAQTFSSADLRAQINALMSQITSLQAQIVALDKNDIAVITVPKPQSPSLIKGIRFNPEVYNSKGESYGANWFEAYDTPSVRSQVVEEMKGIHKITGLTHLVVTFSANRQISWPTPQAAQLNRLVQVVNDANAQGFKVVLMIGQPCIVPNSTYTSANPEYDPNYTKIHVGGHKKGETVNGWQLSWDVPYCPDNSITLAERWYGAITSRLQSGVIDPKGIAYMALAGSPQIPFMSEMNVLYDGYPYRNTVLQYLRSVIPYLKARTTVPIGISLLPATWETTESKQYAFLDVLRSGVPGIFNMLDHVDITSHIQDKTYHTTISVPAILSRIGGKLSRKVILSDFRWRDSELDQTASTRWHVQQGNSHNLGGWWMWHYKTDSLIGMREAGSFGATTAGWHQPLTNFIRSISGLEPLATVPVISSKPVPPKIISISSKGQGPSQLVIGQDGYIVGTGFLASNTLIIDGWSADVSSTNGTLITFTVPKLAPGPHVLILKNANGSVPYKEAVMFFVSPPTVSVIDPNPQLASVLSSLQALIQRLSTAFGF